MKVSVRLTRVQRHVAKTKLAQGCKAENKSFEKSTQSWSHLPLTSNKRLFSELLNDKKNFFQNKKTFKENANCESFYFKFVCRLFLILGQLKKEKNENKF